MSQVEVYADDYELIETRRFGTNLIQLIYDKDTHGYYLHHRRQGKLLLYEFVSDQFEKAITCFQNFIKDAKYVFGE